MGILNVTPDSFSDGGHHFELGAAIRHAMQMIDEGAEIIDIGGESTRPGSAPVSVQQEIDRVIPVIEALRAESGVVISIDTMKPAVMRAACAAGAEIVNDVMALQAPGALDVVAQSGAAACLMHMQGQPQTMQANPQYKDVLAEVREFLAERVGCCRAAGVAPNRLLVDPGIGFGKSLEHNLQLLSHLDQVSEDGCPVLVGVSRKSMFGALLERAVDERLPAGLAVAALAIWQGAAIVRAHDVRATVDAVRCAHALHVRRAVA
ncbi:dihydropteroate synthase [Sinimarinibacterium sp. CAU 1509]|nr:dihydropteroate synthase [Sinimarinibacterium sp. CAU 1509]